MSSWPLSLRFASASANLRQASIVESFVPVVASIVGDAAFDHRPSGLCFSLR